MSKLRKSWVGLSAASLLAGSAGLVLLGTFSLPGCGSDPKPAATGTGGAGGGSGGSPVDGAAGSGGSAGDDGGTVDGGSDAPTTACKDEFIKVVADITADTTWECNSYILTKRINVTNNATLTIAAGSTVYGDGNASNVAALAVTRTGRVVAVGTPTSPIVFTSFANVGERMPGDTLGGIALLGKATINNGTCVGDPDPATTACEAPGFFQGAVEGIASTDPLGQFGGTDDTHDCGELRYVRVEFAGFAIAVDQELNGITVAGCGSKTKLSHIQVHRGFDDGVEFFGGTASIDHLLVTGQVDDGIDWDTGWRGKAQFVIIHEGYGTGDKAMEADSFTATEAQEPRSAPELWNVTLIGENRGIAMHLRRGTRGKLNNMILHGWTGGALDIEAAQVPLATEWPTHLSIEGSVFSMTPWVSTTESATADMGFDEAASLMDAARMNSTADPMLGSLDIKAPNYVPANAAAVNGKGTPPAGFDATATYAGAVEPGTATPWYAGWTAFPEK